MHRKYIVTVETRSSDKRISASAIKLAICVLNSSAANGKIHTGRAARNTAGATNVRASIHQRDYLGKQGDRVGGSRGKLVPNCGRRG